VSPHPPHPPQSRTVDVGPERLARWLQGFTDRHGAPQQSVAGDALSFVAPDGATAVFDPPFPPLPPGWAEAARAGADPVSAIAEHALRRRVVGVLLVRLGGFAAGVFDGDELVASKVGSRQVHGRSAAGGWSQQRFARRREGQVKVALDAATAAAALVLLPASSRIDVVVTGGDRPALRTVLADPRLSALRARVSARILDVPDPKARILRESLEACRAVRVTITEPG
jgi:peptide subunit release factor 1 (eRF1)